MNPRLVPLALAALVVLVPVLAPPAFAQEQEPGAALSQRLTALEADPEYNGLAEFELFQARQAVATLVEARSSERDGARYVAERRVEIAEVVARTEAMQREIDRLERLRADLLIEASRRDAAQARAEIERLRIQARIQAEETARLRQQAMADDAVMQDVEAALQGVAGDQAAKLKAAREREAELARQEAELLRQLEEAEAAAEAASAAETQAEAAVEAEPAADDGGDEAP